MPRFRKKPVEIEARKFETNNDDGSHLDGLVEWIKGSRGTAWHDGTDLHVYTLEGEMRAGVGDMIIKGVKGEFYPCKPDIFEATYEAIVDYVYTRPRAIEFKIGDIYYKPDGPYAGRKASLVTIVGATEGSEELIGTQVEVVDCFGCAFDAPDEVVAGKWGWATSKEVENVASTAGDSSSIWVVDDRVA